MILLTDINSRIPVTVATSAKDATANVQAMMTGDNSAWPALDMVSRQVTLHAGDQVVSSGDGGLLPPGLPIGTVVQDSAGGWRVQLLADAGSTQDVEVLNFSKPPEALPAAAELPAVAAGLKPMVPPPPAPIAAATIAPVVPKPAPTPKVEAETPPNEDVDR